MVCFYAPEPNGPPHVHVDRVRASYKVWLVSALSSCLGCNARDLREIVRLVSLKGAILLKACEEFYC